MQPINLFFKPSLLLVGFFVSIAILALLVLWLLPLLWWFKLVVSFAVVLQTAFVIKRHFLLATLNSINAVSVNHQQQLSIYQNNGNVQYVDLCEQTFVSVYLTVLRLKGSARDRYTVLITPLNTDQNSFRQLRVWLKWRENHNDRP